MYKFEGRSESNVGLFGLLGVLSLLALTESVGAAAGKVSTTKFLLGTQRIPKLYWQFYVAIPGPALPNIANVKHGNIFSR